MNIREFLVSALPRAKAVAAAFAATAFVSVLGGSSCAGTEPIAEESCFCAHSEAIQATLGENFTLQIGETALIGGADVCIRLDSVPSDSRCPLNALCVWPGNAKVAITVCTKSGESAQRELNTFTEPKTATFLNYQIDLAELNPYPVAIEDTTERKAPYTAVLVVRKRE
jgi:hypothetical protein